MEGFEFDPLGIFLDFLNELLSPFVDFIVSFLPDGDPAVFAIIDGFGNIGADLTFNVFWFVEWNSVSACLAVLIVVMLVTALIKIEMKAIGLVSKAVESVPIVE